MNTSDKSKIKNPLKYYYTNVSENLYNQMRFYHLLSTLIGALAIIPATIDYELRFSRPLRKLSNLKDCEKCEQNDVDVFYRISILFLSFLAIILLIPYKKLYYDWLKSIPFTYREFPPVQNISVLEVLEMQRKRKFLEYFTEENIWLALVVFLIFPYPGDETSFHIPQQILYTKVKVCYYFAELAYAIMVLRLVLLASSLFNYGKYQTRVAKNAAEKYGIYITTSFSMKCYIGANPMPILIFGFLIPGVIIFGHLTRIFERPVNSSVFGSIENSYWNIIITMTTVGYGDTFAISILGRIMIILSIFWGGIILSLTFVTVGQVLKMNLNEIRAYNSIILGRAAADTIESCLNATKLYTRNNRNWEIVKGKLRAFLNLKNSSSGSDSYILYLAGSAVCKLNTIETRTDRIVEKLFKFRDTLK
ncbi:hypothetical protein SteCoe_25178 [Stentor coeruleus]|uniref:Potassium channel domain-containing protein n=1 Tax=Stentor coeruleus TaxID=5963 RepID=A0A1R2BFU6_9CILI|nr:hypothetical protein SteCoe_25178 [Stentor coeruleus]